MTLTVRRCAPCLAGLLLILTAAPAMAGFPYSREGTDTSDYSDIYLGAGQVPGDLSEKEIWMYSATAEPGNLSVNLSPAELMGVRDVVRCGFGDDSAIVDRRDLVRGGCERVRVRRP